MGQGTVGAALVMNINSVALNFSGIFFITYLRENNGFLLKMFVIFPNLEKTSETYFLEIWHIYTTDT